LLWIVRYIGGHTGEAESYISIGVGNVDPVDTWTDKRGEDDSATLMEEAITKCASNLLVIVEVNNWQVSNGNPSPFGR
jgi:hypothetical protein